MAAVTICSDFGAQKNKFSSPIRLLFKSPWIHGDWTPATLMAESEEELKSLDESESGEQKSWPKAQHSENKDHGIPSHHFMADRWGNSVRLYFGGLQKSLQMVTAAIKLKDAYSLEENL